MEWDAELLVFLQQLTKPVILCGDMNVARDYIDIYPENLRNEENPPGFCSAEREGLETLLNAGFVDVFRQWYPKESFCKFPPLASAYICPLRNRRQAPSSP